MARHRRHRHRVKHRAKCHGARSVSIITHCRGKPAPRRVRARPPHDNEVNIAAVGRINAERAAPVAVAPVVVAGPAAHPAAALPAAPQRNIGRMRRAIQRRRLRPSTVARRSSRRVTRSMRR